MSFKEILEKQTKDLRLSSAEKASMRTALNEHLKAHPLSTLSRYYPVYRMVLSGAFSFVLLLVLAGGTSYAAQGSIPGDFLYPIKVRVNEPLRVALAPDDSAKAQTEATIALTRVDEAKTLAAKGKLNVSVSKELKKDFDTHATQALQYAANAKVTAGPAPAAPSSEDSSTSTTLTARSKATTTMKVSKEKEEEEQDEHGPLFTEIKTSLKVQATLLGDLEKQASSTTTTSLVASTTLLNN
jgi:hypothetical protein